MKKEKAGTIKYTEEMRKSDSYLGHVLNTARNVLSRMAGGIGVSPNGKRDYNRIFGYGGELGYADYLAMTKRGGIAKVIINKPPNMCWRSIPKIMLGDKEILQEEMKTLKRMKFFKSLERADILNRIGGFSVMLIGVPDSLDLHLPVGSASKGNFKGLYFKPYSCAGITVAEVDSDPASTRYGLPLIYTLQTVDIDGSSRIATISRSINVHYSRVVHIAEGLLDSDVEGTPALEAPWNALQDKEKVRGSSSESYYRNSRQKLALEVSDGATLSKDPDVVRKLKDNVENFQDGYEDVLRLDKMKANMLQPSVVSPRDMFDICVEECAGTSGLPVRILTTKSGGTVTGSEDKATLNAMIADRQEMFCADILLDGLSILDESGVLSLPEGATVEWEPQSALSETEKSESTSKKAGAFKSVMDGLYIAGGDIADSESVFREVGLDGIKLDKGALSGLDEEELERA